LPACGRSVEDCYANNKRAEKAAVFAGWKEMNDYMRENNIAAVPAGPDTAMAAAKAEAEDVEAAGDKSGEKTADKGSDKAGVKAAKRAPPRPSRPTRPATNPDAHALKARARTHATRPGRPRSPLGCIPSAPAAVCRAALCRRRGRCGTFGVHANTESPMLNQPPRHLFVTVALLVLAWLPLAGQAAGTHGFGQGGHRDPHAAEFQAIELAARWT
jgi:hypothetical protein